MHHLQLVPVFTDFYIRKAEANKVSAGYGEINVQKQKAWITSSSLLSSKK